MATLLELSKIKHHAVRSDGAKFLDGERNDALDTSWLTVNNGQVTLGPGLYDELLVVNDEVIDDQIKAWAAMGSPFYDAAGNIVYEGAGGRIEMDKDGQRFIRSDGQTMIEMDTETGGARFAADITGSSGTFADGKVVIGELAGKPWGDSVLPAGTAGIWGDQAGLYLKGYAKIIDWGFAYDEDIVDVSGYPNLSNPFVVATPKEMVSSSPNSEVLTHLYVDAISVGEGKYVIKAKNMIKHAVTPWGGVAATTGEFTFVQPEGYVEGKKGVHTDFFICRPTWRIVDLGLAGNTAKLWMDVTDEFDSSGDPVNWRTVRNFGRMMIGSGTLNWDTALPHFGQWALRVRGKGLKILFSDVAFVGLEQSGYRGSTQYMDNGGNIFDPIDIDDPSIEPSGMSVFYFVLDRG